MEKVKTIIPEKFRLLGHSVAISETVFNDIVRTLNAQSEAINLLIDDVTTLANTSVENSNDIKELQNSLQALAKAVKTLTED